MTTYDLWAPEPDEEYSGKVAVRIEGGTTYYLSPTTARELSDGLRGGADGAEESAEERDATNGTHTGRPTIRRYSKGVVILCPLGHVVDTIATADWAGSQAEARMGDPNATVTCSGNES